MGRLWFHLTGYVIIRVKGSRLEYFLNMANREGIQLWNVSRPVPDRLYCHVPLEGFRRLRPIAKALHLAVEIRRKRGLPFLIHRVFERRALLVGSLLFLLAMYVMSGHIWFLDLSQVPDHLRDDVLHISREAGLTIGVAKDEVEPREVERQLLAGLDDLSWAAVKLRGTAAFIEAVERTTFQVDRDIPCHLVAAKSGLLTSVIAFAGVPIVKEGETVRAGDILISGVLPVNSVEGLAGEDIQAPNPILGESRGWGYLHADGLVEAETYYEAEATEVYDGSVTQRTGRSSTSYKITLPWFTLVLGRKAAPFVEFETEEEVAKLWTKTTYYELQSVLISKDYDQARVDALARARAKIRAQIPPEAKVLDEQVQWEDNEGEIKARVMVSLLEIIGTGQLIRVGDPPPPGVEGIVSNDQT